MGTAGSLAEQTGLLVRSLTREGMSRCDEAVERSQVGFGLVAIDSGYNLGYVVDMGQDSAVDIDDEGFRLAETGHWKCCDMKDGY